MVGWLVGEAVSLGVVVGVWLGVMDKNTVAVSEGIVISVFVWAGPSGHAATPANPRLYASNKLKYLKPVSISLDDISLPSGCCTNQL
jgi:hypothetical protein